MCWIDPEHAQSQWTNLTVLFDKCSLQLGVREMQSKNNYAIFWEQYGAGKNHFRFAQVKCNDHSWLDFRVGNDFFVLKVNCFGFWLEKKVKCLHFIHFYLALVYNTKCSGTRVFNFVSSSTLKNCRIRDCLPQEKKIWSFPQTQWGLNSNSAAHQVPNLKKWKVKDPEGALAFPK